MRVRVGSPLWFAQEFVPGFLSPPHVCEFAEASCELLTNPSVNRQVIEAPVRHGKSHWHSIVMPAYHQCIWPEKKVLGVSYGAELSDEFSHVVKSILKEVAPIFGLEFERAWDRSNTWRFKQGGGYDSCGVGGAITGKGYHYIAADDLYKDQQSAASLATRRTVARWFKADMMTRIEPGGKVSLVASRRHPEDISGECLAMNDDLPPENLWHQVTFRAIDEETGHALWPQRYSIEWLSNWRAEREAEGEGYLFECLFQQDPRADPASCIWNSRHFISSAEHPFWFKEGMAMPPIRHFVLTMDASMGAKNSDAGDFTAIVPMEYDSTGTIWVGRSIMQRCEWDQAANMFADEIARKKPRAAIMDTSAGQEPLRGVVQRRLDELDCRVPLCSFDTQENKVGRIRVDVSPYVERNRLRFLECHGNRLIVKQMENFPSGTNDDGPDAISIGIRLLDRLCK